MAHPRNLLLIGALALAACSGGGDDAAVSTAPTTTAAGADAAPADEQAVEKETVEDDAALASKVVPQWSVSIDVTVDGFGQEPIDASVAWTGDPNDVVEGGPFGEFASCSGLREDVAAYSVFVSGSDPLAAVDVWTATPVTGAGLYDAEVRVEHAAAPPLAASGTLTIHDGLQAGEFLAFGPDGGRIEGTFSCSGAEPPSPLSAEGTADGAVEVFAVLRSGEAERFLGLATDATDAAVCDPPGDPVLRVDGDATIGAITAIDLSALPAASARLRVAGTDYEFSDVNVVLDDAAGASGAFTATNPDGVSVDGAFRCT